MEKHNVHLFFSFFLKDKLFLICVLLSSFSLAPVSKRDTQTEKCSLCFFFFFSISAFRKFILVVSDPWVVLLGLPTQAFNSRSVNLFFIELFLYPPVYSSACFTFYDFFFFLAKFSLTVLADNQGGQINGTAPTGVFQVLPDVDFATKRPLTGHKAVTRLRGGDWTKVGTVSFERPPPSPVHVCVCLCLGVDICIPLRATGRSPAGGRRSGI